MRILFFAHLKDVTGQREIEWNGGPVDMDGFWRKLLDSYPELERFRPSVRLAKNGEYVQNDALFADSDEVALIPPVSGG